MPRTQKYTTPFPDRQTILDYIYKNKNNVSKRDISRAFNLNSEQKRTLKKVLRDFYHDGIIIKRQNRGLSTNSKVPQVGLVKIIGPDQNGDLVGQLANWNEAPNPPLIYIGPKEPGAATFARGDCILARLKKII